MGIPENVAARKAAETVVELLRDEAEQHGEALDSFWSTIVDAVPDGYFAEPLRDEPPMTENEAKAFEQRTMQFGAHTGKRVADVPLEYLFWLEHAGKDDIRRLLGRYLLSDRVLREQEDPESGTFVTNSQR